MNKMELVADIAATAKLSKSDAMRSLDAFITVIERALKKGEEVRIVGFGTFGVAVRKAGMGRNPRTGEEIQIPKKKRVKFKGGKQLADAIQ
ncbi:MAG: HU family DNA-binding protein [Bdellovibrionales bacterium]